MRVPRSISPSAFMLSKKDLEEYVIKYIVDFKPPREPQPLPASVGSAFDACVKSKLHSDLFGEGNDPQFEFEAIFESQVEEHNRDAVLPMGWHVFENYVDTGSYDDLLKLMENAKEAPQFEFDANCVVGGVPLFGKPDCRFVDQYGNHIILDWKVRGYCSIHSASPTKGFRLCRDGIGWLERNLTKAQLKKREEGGEVSGKHSQNHDKPHKLYMETDLGGVLINMSFLETCNIDWATQLSMYGWMMGEDVGNEDVIVCLDEVVAKYMNGEDPLLRVANHRSHVSKAFQLELQSELSDLWELVNSNWIFRDMSREESEARVGILQNRASGMATDGSDEENWYSNMGRPSFR